MSGPGRIGRRRSALRPSRRRSKPTSPDAELELGLDDQIVATARQLMSPAPSGVDEFDSLVLAAQRMRSQGVGTIPVRGVGNRFVGMLSDRDIIERCVADARDPRAVPACAGGSDVPGGPRRPARRPYGALDAAPPSDGRNPCLAGRPARRDADDLRGRLVLHRRRPCGLSRARWDRSTYPDSPRDRRNSRPCSLSVSSLASVLSITLVSLGGNWMSCSAAMPACNWRPRYISASSSAPNSNARLVIHSQSRKMITPANEPYVLL